MKKRLSQIFPWITAALILALLFRFVPPQDVWKAIQQANIPLFLLYGLFYFLIVYLWDSMGLTWALKRFSVSIPYPETLLMRGATYLLMIINYNLGQGGVAFYLKRAHGAPLFRTLGAVFYLSLVDLTLVMSTAVLAVLMADIHYRGLALRPLILQLGTLFYAGLILWLVFWKIQNTSWGRALNKKRFFRKLTEQSLFFPFREATLRDHGTALALRLPLVLFINGSFILWMMAFHSVLPFSRIFLYGPVLMLVGTLPITPGGLGTVQALAIEFFKNDLVSPLLTQGISAAEILMAATLLATFLNMALKALLGLYCLHLKAASLFYPDENRENSSPIAENP